MAHVYRELLKRQNPQGECEIALKVTVTRDKKIRIRSGVWINPAVWNKRKRDINLPTIPGRERELLAGKRSRIEKIVQKLDTAIVCCDKPQNISKLWLEGVIFGDVNVEVQKKAKKHNIKQPKLTLLQQMQEYLKAQKLSKSRIDHLEVFERMLLRFEMYKRLESSRSYVMYLDTLSVDTIAEIEVFITNEHCIFDEYPEIYQKYPARLRPNPKTGGVKRYVKSDNQRGRPSKRGLNYVADVMTRFRTFIRWAVENDVTKNNPFKKYPISEPVYGRPIYISIEERNRLYSTDMSDDKQLETQRDVFVLQCFLGCRIGDYYEMTYDNIINGAIEYIANKTNKKNPVTIRVPLADTALEIIEKYRNPTRHFIMPFIAEQNYNEYIKIAFKRTEITRMVTVLNQFTHKNEHRPINEIASSHMARRTFIGNIYKQVKDQNLVSALSGHKEGSKAFARYRDIDDELRRDMVKLLG